MDTTSIDKLFEKFGTLRGPKLLIRAFPQEDIKTAGGLVIANPKQYKDTQGDFRPYIGKVIAVGDGYAGDSDAELVPLETEVGNIVWYSGVSGTKFTQVPGDAQYIQEGLFVIPESAILKVWDSQLEYDTWVREVQEVK